jgi:hypothetical protein
MSDIKPIFDKREYLGGRRVGWLTDNKFHDTIVTLMFFHHFKGFPEKKEVGEAISVLERIGRHKRGRPPIDESVFHGSVGND